MRKKSIFFGLSLVLNVGVFGALSSGFALTSGCAAESTFEEPELTEDDLTSARVGTLLSRVWVDSFDTSNEIRWGIGTAQGSSNPIPFQFSVISSSGGVNASSYGDVTLGLPTSFAKFPISVSLADTNDASGFPVPQGIYKIISVSSLKLRIQSAQTGKQYTFTAFKGPSTLADGQSCGGFRRPIVGVPTACGENSYCKMPNDVLCGRLADAPGVCAPKITACQKNYMPVCGCDGKTYGNSCLAEQANAGIASQGECIIALSEGALCGTRGVRGRCGEGLFCNYDGHACGATDLGGHCAVIPEMCTKQYMPVCGCDNITYGNDCMAHAAGASVKASGACP